MGRSQHEQTFTIYKGPLVLGESEKTKVSQIIIYINILYTKVIIQSQEITIIKNLLSNYIQLEIQKQLYDRKAISTNATMTTTMTKMLTKANMPVKPLNT